LGYLLGIDVGTTELKAALFDEEGREVAAGRAEYSPYIPEPDIVELDAEEYWNSCKKVISEILNSSKINPREIRSIAVSSQGETLIPVNREGEPLRRAIVWLDNRSKNESEMIREQFGIDAIFRVTGQPEVVPTWPATKILWLRRNEPEIFNKVHKYLLVEDFIIFKLTGIFATEYSLVSSTLMFDISEEDWWEEMLGFIGINREQLPELMPSGAAVGNVGERASRETGLSTNTMVATGALDQAAGAVGTGNIKPGIITESTGTALALLATVESPLYDPKRRVPCHHHAAAKKYLLIPWCPTAGAVLRWFRDEFGQYEVEAAKRIKVNAYDLLTLEASKVPAGSDGLIILPHFMGAGAPEFDPHARGIIFGLTLKHTKAHVVRAILESIAFMIRRNIELLEELGIHVEEIRSIGGASRSQLWNQIKANVTSKQVITLQIEEAASLGAAILAGVADGAFKSIEEGCKRMIKLKRRYEPQLDDREIYEKLYRVYCNLYSHVKDLFPLL